MTYDQGQAMGALSHSPVRDIQWVRSQFPALAGGFAFLENAGGSQVPASVIRRMTHHMEQSYVQLGASYQKSRDATKTVELAHQLASRMMNGEGIGHTVLGASSTALIQMIADAYGRALPKDAEIVVAECGHEANVGPWMKLAARGFKVRLWPVEPEAQDCTIEGLERVLNEKTRIVAFPHVSNLLGGVWDVASIAERCHRAGARVVVDGVAYAPHRAVDVAVWGVDWYVFSTYKVYGPHLAALFGTSACFEELEGPNHYFFAKDALPEKFEPGGVSHEACAGLLGTGDYLSCWTADSQMELPDRQSIVRALSEMEAVELPLQARLLKFLQSKPGVRIVGPASADRGRVPTISFLSAHASPKQVVERVDQANIGIRYGHMYSKRLCEALSIDPTEGVIRVSAVHYNTLDEIDRLIQALDPIL